MSTHQSNRGVRLYHAFIAILILLAGTAMLSIGIWLEASDRDLFNIGLPTSIGDVNKFSFSATVAAIGVGCFLLIAAVASLIGLSKKCLGITFRFIYVIMALLIVTALVFICVISTITIRRGSEEGITEILQQGWSATALSDPKEICKIEDTYQCRGFRKDDCALCTKGNEQACKQYPDCVKCDKVHNPSIGCYDSIYDTLQKILLPSAIVSGILAGLVLIDIFLTACL